MAVEMALQVDIVEFGLGSDLAKHQGPEARISKDRSESHVGDLAPGVKVQVGTRQVGPITSPGAGASLSPIERW